MTAREAVERHPSVLVGAAPIAKEIGQYDLRDVASRLIEKEYPNRLADYWCAPVRDGQPIYSLTIAVQTAALTLIIFALEGRVYSQPGRAGRADCYPRKPGDPPYEYAGSYGRRKSTL